LKRGGVAAILALAASLGSVRAEAPREARAGAAARVDEVVHKLQKRYDATSDFTADFTQAVEVATLGQTLKSSGRVFFKRPGRMRWEFLEPEKQTIVADGQTLWVYQPEHHQVLKAPFRAAFQSATPVSFLLGVGQLSADFDPSLVESLDEKTLRLKLVPKQDRQIGTLVLDLNRDTFDIVAAEITDPLGNVTRLAFSNMQRGVGLEDARFTFEAPAGTDVVEAPGSS
jgi:outer membrane lipoprotein carrier protein